MVKKSPFPKDLQILVQLPLAWTQPVIQSLVFHKDLVSRGSTVLTQIHCYPSGTKLISVFNIHYLKTQIYFYTSGVGLTKTA